MFQSFFFRITNNYLIFQENKKNFEKINNIRGIKTYNIPYWLYNQHIQTLFFTILRKLPKPKLTFFVYFIL